MGSKHWPENWPQLYDLSFVGSESELQKTLDNTETTVWLKKCIAAFEIHLHGAAVHGSKFFFFSLDSEAELKFKLFVID